MEIIKAALIKGFTEGFGISAEPGEITRAEEALAAEYYDDEIGRDEFVAEINNPADSDDVLAGTHTGAGGTINAFVKLEGPTRGILQRVLISGDFFVTPPRVVFDLEAHLQGSRLDELESLIKQFFDETDIDMLSVTADHFYTSIADALESEKGT
jgi:lipoate-protein ligase A